jgi:hypothetical protein
MAIHFIFAIHCMFQAGDRRLQTAITFPANDDKRPRLAGSVDRLMNLEQLRLKRTSNMPIIQK